MLSRIEEQTYLQSTKEGQQSAFNNIVESYQRPIYNLCYQMLQDTGEAEDAAQEVFLRAYLKLDSYDETRKFSTWLFAIASHYCLDRLKKRRLQTVSLSLLSPWQMPADHAPKPEQNLIQADSASEIQAILNQLSAKQRLIVVMHYWHNMPLAEISEATKMSVGAIKSQLFRARKVMGKMMQSEQYAIPQGQLVSMAL
ncbi:MAG: sigma-70 family RNA polymerase sigma factor [Chloroflexota bacterium]